jgi:hypothetical protein
VIERFLAAASGFDENVQVALVVLLPHVLVERGRSKKAIESPVVPLLTGGDGSAFGLGGGAWVSRSTRRRIFGSRCGFLHGMRASDSTSFPA